MGRPAERFTRAGGEDAVNMFLFGKERKAAKKSAKDAPKPASGSQKRGAFRAPVNLPVSFLIPNDRRPHRRIGIMKDVSMGGVQVIADRGFTAKTPIEMRFILPSKFLDHFTKEVKETVVSPFGERVHKVQKSVRKFEEMNVNGMIVRSTPIADSEKFTLAIRFVDLEPRMQEEIARFIHYYQLWQVRQRKAKEG